jgi:D-alanine-D-alanine ligase
VRWDLVFNICEGLHGLGRESLVPALLEAHGIPCVFSDPVATGVTLHKALCKRVVRDLGLPTPEFAVVEALADLDNPDLAGLPFPLFAKPLAEGTGKGVTAASRIASPGELRRVCASLLREFRQPVLVERFLPGREFTVGIVGTGPAARVVGTMEIVLLQDAEPDVYTYVNKEECERLVHYRLANDEAAWRAGMVALEAYRGLGLRDAGRVDLRLDENGVPHFMEVNPLPGLHPEHSDLPILCTLGGITYQELLLAIMDSALERVRRQGPLPRLPRLPRVSACGGQCAPAAELDVENEPALSEVRQ